MNRCVPDDFRLSFCPQRVFVFKEAVLSFLNPAVLYALVAAGIPLLIHLLNRRKFKRVPFSTITFLKRLERKQMRNLRLRQWLLLLLRTLIVICIVIAFARPTLSEGQPAVLSQRSNIEAVVVLDNSLSLNESRVTGTLLEEARQAITALEEVFREGDRVTVLQATIPQETLVKQEPFRSDLWTRVLQQIQPNYLKSDLSLAIRAGVEQLSRSIYPLRELYVISDFQRSALDLDLLEALPETEGENIRIFLLPLGGGEAENLSVDSVAVQNQLIEVNQPLRIRAVIHNHHPRKYLNSLTSLVLNGNRYAQQNISLAPGEARAVEFQVTMTEDGFIEGMVETESDALLEDNRRYFNFFVPRQLKILHLVPDRQFASYLPIILKPAIEKGIFEHQLDAAGSWSGYNFRDYDVIILESLNQFPETLLQRLQSFSEEGGGVLIFPGENISPPHYQSMLNKFGLGKLAGQFGRPGQAETFLTLQRANWEHPVFEGLLEKQDQKKLAPVEVYAGYRLRAAPGADVLINLSDGSPFLLQSGAKKGAVFFMASQLSPSWSELPYKGLVVPLIYRLVYYSGTRKIHDRLSLRTGAPYRQRFSRLAAPFEFIWKGRSDIEVRLSPRFQGVNLILEYDDTRLPGNYRVYHNRQLLNIVSVNPWAEESLPARISPAELQDVLPRAAWFDDLNNLAELVKQSRFGKELWKYFLIAALILLALEMMAARTGGKREAGPEAGPALES